MKIQDVGRWLNEGQRRMRGVMAFLLRGIWDLDLPGLPFFRRLGVRFLRIVMLVFKGFRDDECAMHASALTFSTLMAIVPVLALCLSMARGLGDADTAKRWVQNRVESWTRTFKMDAGDGRLALAPVTPDVADVETGTADHDVDVRSALAYRINALVEKGFEKVDEVNFARLGTVGLVLLIWMVIEVLGRVERSFNRVWGISAGRTVWRRFTDYLSVLLILPVLIVAAASLPVMDLVTRYMPPETAALVRQLADSGLFRHLVVIGMTTFAFTFFIMFMPNAAMRFRSGLAGGLVAGLLFLGWLWLCAMAQVGVARYSKIYGSFAVAPILLAWVHVSWQIVLFGAEVAFSVENADTFRMEQGAQEANLRARLTLALSLTVEAARGMLGLAPSLDLAAYGRRHRIPVRLLHFVADELSQDGVLAPLAGKPGTYVLLKAPDVLSVGHLLNVVVNSGRGVRDLGLGDSDPAVREAVDRVFGGVDGGLEGLTVAHLARGTVRIGNPA